MIENGEEVQRVLEGSSISLCLDTGHLLIGGTDPAELTRQAPDRIAHTHLKDVDSTHRRQGPRRPAHLHRGGAPRACTDRSGTGDVDVAAIVNTLQGNGYDGWYVLEQDTILTEEPRGEGPGAPTCGPAPTTSAAWSTAAGPPMMGEPAAWNHCGSASSGAARITDLAIVDPARATGDPPGRGRRPRPAPGRGLRRRPTASSGCTTRYADVIADPEVEVVYNPLANSLHGPWNLAAIAAGKHVLTEKPFASNATEAARGPRRRHRGRVTFLEGFHYLYHPVTRRLHELLATGELGQLRHVEVDMVMPAPADDDPRWSLELAGGALMDLGCYSLHAHRMLAPWAGGPPRVVAARGGERAGHPGVDEWLEADLEFPGGATGSARCNMAGEGVRMTCRVVGDRGEATAANFALPHHGRPGHHHHPRRPAGRAPRHPPHLHLPAGGAPGAPPRRRPAAHRRRRRPGDHGADRRLLPRRRLPAPPTDTANAAPPGLAANPPS